MKTLILLRHAKSGWDEPVSRDFDRPINVRGKRGSEVMGRWMRNEAIGFDLIVASPAIRCVETIEHLAVGYGETLAPMWDNRVYLASAAGLLEVIQDWPDTAERVLLVGHNPGFESLAALLSTGQSGDHRGMPPAGIAVLDFEPGAEIEPGGARLSAFWAP